MVRGWMEINGIRPETLAGMANKILVKTEYVHIVKISVRFQVVI